MKRTIGPTTRKARRVRVIRPSHNSKAAKLNSSPHQPFSIVALGASAGGLEALDQFLSHVPPASGLGFVIVQHMDPTHKGILVDLLQRKTRMPVVQIQDRMKVEADHVYVIPPNKDLSILHGVLHLLEPAAARGLRLPIDFFLTSLAADQHERCIGVILSGMGSDGTLGLRAIKEQGGATFVQTPASAKFDSMPRMAIDAGLADAIAPAEELASKILAFLKHVPLLRNHDRPVPEKDDGALDKIIILLRGQSGQDFSLYKRSTISRRVERRMGLHQITKIGNYVRYLREHPQESELLFKELLIGVTSFFRDPSVWEQLKTTIIPKLLTAYPKGGMLRAWTVGCSTGEEAYSLAMVFREVVDRVKPGKNLSLQIFATDLDKDAINKARAGVYPSNINADVSHSRLRKFFVKEKDGTYRITKQIREMVIFAPQNLVMHPPFTRLDIITCRNLLIYLDAELQKKVIPLFNYSLNPGGVLLLGSAETIGTASDLFSPLVSKARLYRRLDTSRPSDHLEFPSAFARHGTNSSSVSSAPAGMSPAPSLQSLADQLLLQHYSPAAVLVTNEGDILYVSGKTGKYLEPAAGKANWNLFAMAREGLGSALSEAFHKAVRQKLLVTLKDIKVGKNGDAKLIDITVQPLTTPEALRGMVMVVFTDVAAPSPGKARTPSKQTANQDARLSALAEELQQAHQDLNSTRDEMQISQEELKSTNEELQSMNEELQSTNEELTTSKEEMQSMNEELQTVNHELQAKVNELSSTSDDMKNLLNSTDIATLFLDNALLVRRFTTQAATIIQLIPSDVGRPITDIVTAMDYPRLAADIRGVLKKKVSLETQIATRDRRWFTVRIMPYRTQSNRADGVVITFANITVAKNLEAALRQAQVKLEKRYTTQTTELGKARKSIQTKTR